MIKSLDEMIEEKFPKYVRPLFKDIRLWDLRALPKEVQDAVRQKWRDHAGDNSLISLHLGDLEDADPNSDDPWDKSALIITKWFLDNGVDPKSEIYIHYRW